MANGVEEQQFRVSYRQGLADNAGVPLSDVGILSMEAGSIAVRTEVTYRHVQGLATSCTCTHGLAAAGSFLPCFLCETWAGSGVAGGLLRTLAVGCPVLHQHHALPTLQPSSLSSRSVTCPHPMHLQWERPRRACRVCHVVSDKCARHHKHVRGYIPAGGQVWPSAIHHRHVPGLQGG